MDFLTDLARTPKPEDFPYGPGRAKYVKFAEGDIGVGVPKIFFEDPHQHNPKPGPKGQIHQWGLSPYGTGSKYVEEDSNYPAGDDMITSMQRKMTTQMSYGGPGQLQTPEKQFVEVLVERKKKQLESLNLDNLPKRDVIITIRLHLLNDKTGAPRIYRRFRVSAGIRLNVFQDKIVAPIMGWTRNLHAYTFTDFRDGSLFGPEESRHIDMVYLDGHGYDYLPDNKYMLAHLFSKEGDEIGYLYDFGDRWYHEMKLKKCPFRQIEKILDIDSSDGEVRIIEGRGMCPGENLHGVHGFREFIDKYENEGDYRKKQEQKREILGTPNYKSYHKPASLFDPFSFDMEWTQKLLNEALASPTSIPSGARSFKMPMRPDALDPTTWDDPTKAGKKLKKGQAIVREFDTEQDGLSGMLAKMGMGGHWEETVHTQRDKRAQTVCAMCGKPGGQELKQCSGCKRVLYCSRDHQRAHWKSHHKKQCTKEYIGK
ncbi:hypothetical protein D9758_006485 [Tetrapyrgos nigripes]|uniref:MYND-type domain-containing protein n=1 Tax=Tetrapyrgos nigripes TaxID=182062 RepID=A0A8H5LRG9_9AGAR|nr:hypothetical protein D9758_006485 [Tetrapyrgos nigripes]